MSHHRLAVQNVHFAYPGGEQVLSGLSFEIGHGDSVGVVGANGAGKTTLLKHLNGILLPNQGHVTVGDVRVTEGSLAHVRQTVGTVFQDPDDQLFMPSVFEDVAFGPLNFGMDAQDCASRVQSCLEQVGAWHLKDRAPHQLSGGEKRRVAIAAVLSMSPGILLLDEPSTGLDPKGRRQIIDLLKGFSHSKVIVSHDLELVRDLCPRTIVLCEGKVAADGKTDALLMDAALMDRAGLEVPASLRPCLSCGKTNALQPAGHDPQAMLR
ncbi:putative enzyme [Rhodospirillaceae bacterium LM-1]|nr:putative enzyme [Rhodospirillaceae bacterium LM-1]